MNEQLSSAKIEDAIGVTEAFLRTERGAGIDGGYAGDQIAARVATVQERANALLQAVPYPGMQGLYVPLSKHNAHQFDEAAAVLPGYMVLVPSSLVETGSSAFYPAAVSEDGLRTGTIRLHVLKQPYNRRMRSGAAMVLSAAGQSETPGIGEHGQGTATGAEAEHFPTLLAVGSDPGLQSAWQAGIHVNHTWRKQQRSSVTAEVSSRLFGADIPQATITLTRAQISAGKAMLLWHQGMRDEATGTAETATKENALVIMQGLGFQALRSHNPRALDTVKRLLA